MVLATRLATIAIPVAMPVASTRCQLVEDLCGVVWENPHMRLLTPAAVGELLGFSHAHVRRLIDAGELEAVQLPGSSHWNVSARSVAAFEERRQRANERANQFSRELDELGAPLE